MKDEEVRARVPKDMKDQLQKIADDRYQNISVILRDALFFYLEHLKNKSTIADKAGLFYDMSEHDKKRPYATNRCSVFTLESSLEDI
jgi:hypothetical protein